MELSKQQRDLTGYRSGRLVVISYLGRSDSNSERLGKWRCRCDCGKSIDILASSLVRKNATKSCGCLQRESASKLGGSRRDRPQKDLTGLRVGRLVVIEFAGVDPKSVQTTSRRLTWRCRCDCGNIAVIRAASLTSPCPTQSCGCLRDEYLHSLKQVVVNPSKEPLVTECIPQTNEPILPASLGKSLPRKSPAECNEPLITRSGHDQESIKQTSSCLPFTDPIALSQLAAIIDRCHNPENPYWAKFGGNGISVDPLWRSSPDAFCNWVRENLGLGEVGKKIVRLNRYKDFEPGNIKWSEF